MEQKATVGAIKIEAHYDAKKNITKIKRKLKEDDEKEIKESLDGLRILKVVTDKGMIRVDY